MSGPEHELILQQKWEDLACYIYANILRDMPKSERFTLGADIRSLVWKVENAIIQLAMRYGNRSELLRFVAVNHRVMLAMIRLGIRMGVIPQKRYQPVSVMLVEISRILEDLRRVL